MEPNPFQRSVAVKVTLQEIFQCALLQDELGTFLLLPSADSSEKKPIEKKCARINVMATVLQKETQGNMTHFLIDDGTGTILARFFEVHPHLGEFKIGDAVIVMGKVRAYNQEKYISPEIMKKISPAWLKVRALENRMNGKSTSALQNAQNNGDEERVKKRVSSEEGISEREENSEELPQQKIIAIIKELDQGSGAPMQEIIEKSPLRDIEFLLERMMERGEIFQILPGKVKVL